MSNLKEFKANRKFLGVWNVGTTYSKGSTVKSPIDLGAYTCQVAAVTGGADPSANPTAWGITVATLPTLTTSQSYTNHGSTINIAAGSTKYVAGHLWTLTATGGNIALTKYYQNCNCNCNCDCSWLGSDCLTQCEYVGICTLVQGDCNCTAVNCNCACACNSSGNCDGYNGNCHCEAGYNCNCNCLCGNCDCICAMVNCKPNNCACTTNCDCSYQCDCNCSPI